MTFLAIGNPKNKKTRFFKSGFQNYCSELLDCLTFISYKNINMKTIKASNYLIGSGYQLKECQVDTTKLFTPEYLKEI